LRRRTRSAGRTAGRHSTVVLHRAAATAAAAIDRELDRAERYAQTALAPSTRRAYEQDWLLFATWCAERRVVAIPAQPASVAAFLAAEADRGFRPVTIGRRAAAIAAAHRAQDHPNPCDSARPPH